MGLIKAGIGAIGSTLADQWKEFYYCDAMDVDTLVIKGRSAFPDVPPTQKAAIT